MATNAYKIFSLNVRGIGNSQKRRAIFEKHRIHADILVLQETHSIEEEEKIWENEWGGKIIFSHGTSAARGVAALMSKSIYSKVRNIYSDSDGRIICFDLCDEVVVSICAIYAPNEDKPEFFQNIELLMQERSENKVILGDFNLTMDVNIDRENTFNNNNKSRDKVLDMCNEFCLIDIWRSRNLDQREYSWIKKNCFPIKASRLDFALLSGGLDQYVEMVEYISSIKTDHRGIYVVLQLSPFERGLGYWKLNCSLLQNQNYVEFINREIELTLQSSRDKTPCEKWEKIKERVKKASVKYSRQSANQDKFIIAQLCEVVNDYESRLPLEEQEYKLYEETKMELEEKTLTRIRGVMFRSKAKWYEEGEKGTKYFYALEKAKYNAKTCYKLIDDDGTEFQDPNKILEEQRKYYQKLYNVDQDVKFNLHNTYGIKVPEEIKIQQDNQITIQELECAIKAMNNNKTPGADGIPVDFYKVFWTRIKDVFYDMMNENYTEKIMHQTARQGILNLIPKPGKDTRFVKNLRPITLLNTDYKIIEKAIANKMLPALEHIIHRDQRGFMKNRRISVNIRKMLDIIQQTEYDDLEAVILSLDFVKCFDKCSFSILHGSLEFFEFGEIVKQWTKILYSDYKVTIQNNGSFSKEIDILKGVHQGGCCSSLYFLVIAEILALSLRSNQEIEGITVCDIRNLLNQFADDMDIFSLASEKSLKAIFSELDGFKRQSGFTLNYEKTTLYRIGSLRHSNAQMYSMDQVVWSNTDINVLGVTITHDDLLQKNYEGIVDKAKNVLESWTNRGLSLVGKIQVVNALVASLFVYKMMVLPIIPVKVVKCVDCMIRNFIWNGRKSKIAYSILQNPKKEGGLNLVELTKKDKSLKATWPQILSQEQEYSKLVYGICRCVELGNNIWRVNLHPKDVRKLKIRSPFWEDVLKCWCEYNYYQQQRIENQLLWYNSKIQVKSKPFYWKDAYQKGLLYVHQLFQDRKFKSDEQVRQEYGLSLLRYNAVKSAMPKEWKEYFYENHLSVYSPLPPHTYDTCLHTQNLSKQIYSFLSEDAMLLHSKFMKWRQDLDNVYDETLVEFAQQHLDIYKVTNVPKYRSFQYRLLQRGIVTNIQLYKWNISNTQLCSFCGEEVETLVHLFVTCEKVKTLWTKIQEYYGKRFKVTHMDMSSCGIIFNKVVVKKNHIMNFVCLISKQFIYRCRCQNEELVFDKLRNQIQYVENIEKYIAIKNGKLRYHERKWLLSENQVERRETYEDMNEYVINYLQGY